MKQDLQSTLDSFKELEKDWDSYGADPIGIGALLAAKVVGTTLSRLMVIEPQPFPTANGGVSLETHLNGCTFTLSFNSDGTFDSFFVEDVSGEFYEFESSEKDGAEMIIGPVPQSVEGTGSNPV